MKKETTFLNICSDTVFKALYKDSKLGKRWINKMIYYICGIDVSDFILIDNELNESKKSKDNVLDLVLKNEESKTIVDLEINKDYYTALDYKNTYYLHRLAGLNLKEGEEYQKIVTIQINLNNYLDELFEDGEFMYRMYDTKHKIYHKDETRIYSIYLPFYKDICYDGENEKEMMFAMLSADSFDKLRNVAKDNEEALKIINDLEHIMNDDTVITAYEQEMINEKLDRSIKKEIERNARNEGIEQGIERGIEQNRLDNASNLLNLGVDKNIISKATGLSLKEIEKLNKDSN